MKDVSFGPAIEVDDRRPGHQNRKMKAYFFDRSVEMIHIPEIVDLRTLKVALHEIGHVVARKQRKTFRADQWDYESEQFAEKFAAQFMKKHGLTPTGKWSFGDESIWTGNTMYAQSWKREP